MKFKDKNGCIFIPTSKFTEDEMKKSKLYEVVKDKPKEVIKQPKAKQDETNK